MPQTVAPGKTVEFAGEVTVPNARLWDLESPAMYAAKVEVREGNATFDDETVPFGIREARFDADTGFWLNGKNFKIKGVCLHGDGGAVGTAVPLRVWERRLEQLKRDRRERHPHRAQSVRDPAFLDLCDRMGFLVMDEMFDSWTVAKNPVRLSPLLPRMVARRYARHRAARPQSPQHRSSTARATRFTIRRRPNWPKEF